MLLLTVLYIKAKPYGDCLFDENDYSKNRCFYHSMLCWRNF